MIFPRIETNGSFWLRHAEIKIRMVSRHCSHWRITCANISLYACAFLQMLAQFISLGCSTRIQREEQDLHPAAAWGDEVESPDHHDVLATRDAVTGPAAHTGSAQIKT